MLQKPVVLSLVIFLSLSLHALAETENVEAGNTEVKSAELKGAEANQGLAESLLAVQLRWAELYYSKEPNKTVIPQMELLVSQTSGLLQEHPNSAEVLIWDALAIGSLAQRAGGLSVLSKAKLSRSKLEQAIKIDPEAQLGAAQLSLGTLYYKVPGWPLGFGNMKKARQYLEQALAMNPEGMDHNYFYAEFLVKAGEKQKAIEHLKVTLAAPSSEIFAVAYEGRAEQANQLLEKLQR